MRVRRAICTAPALAAALVVAIALTTAVAAKSATGLASRASSTGLSTRAFVDGSLTLTASPTGAVLSARTMAPGDEAVGSVAIVNTGTLAGRFALSAEATGALAEALHLSVYRDRDREPWAIVYDGPIAGASAGLGEIQVGERHRFHIRVRLARDTPNALQGATAAVAFHWTAVSV